MVVLDTNVVIDYLIGKKNVISAVDKYSSWELAITFVNQYELLKYHKRKEIEKPIEGLKVYQSSEQAVKVAVNAYVSMLARGKPMSDNDLIIYGVCFANNEVLLTQDKAFENLQSKLVKLIE